MHHFIAVFATFSAMMVGSVYPLIAASTIFTEISTIVLHFRFYMIKWKMAEGYPFIAVMITFISLFGYSRMYVQMKVMYMQYLFYKQQEDTFLTTRHFSVRYFQHVCNAMGFLLQALNVFWFYKMMLGVRRVLTKGMKEAKSGTRDAQQELSQQGSRKSD